ncbi:MAG: NAD(P)/FAD-dependent oxidoreductase [Nitrososphaera sp.]|uniref:NAD(P)/FAD-dependent oxidoreductase n=1 Tax=Nitrososphaera sp. TaxID=1971748 RepID=UPI003D6DDFCA
MLHALTYIMPAAIIALVLLFLKVKHRARFLCAQCDVSFSWIDSLCKHAELVHGSAPAPQTRILILGSGFAGMEALKRLQSRFQSGPQVDITLVSRNNFFLFTPMLHEVASGMIDTRHIAAPVRALCQRARFYESEVESVDLEGKRVVITHAVGREPSGGCRPEQLSSHALRYDYLVLALGNRTRFSGDGVEKNAFALKDLYDTILLRNHVISMLEQADQMPSSPGVRRELMTFVVAGGGFSGVEVVGELNDFVRDAIKGLYHNIDPGDVQVVLVSSADRLLPDLDRDLGEFALRKLLEKGVKVMLNTRVERHGRQAGACKRGCPAMQDPCLDCRRDP